MQRSTRAPAFAPMKTAAASKCLQVVVSLLLFCGCLSAPVEPPWVAEAKKITVGMTRTEAEALLPANATIDMSFGSTGNHRDFYAAGEQWRVAIIYRAPFETNLYISEISTNEQKVTRGPLNGWTYRPTPDQRVIAGPFIERVRSRDSQFVDPFGSFTAKAPVRRERDGAANGSQPIRSETNSASSAAGSRR
jgi:hypothetical protein